MSGFRPKYLPSNRRRCVKEHPSYEPSSPLLFSDVIEKQKKSVFSQNEETYMKSFESDNDEEESITIDLSEFLNENPVLTETAFERCAENYVAATENSSQFLITDCKDYPYETHKLNIDNTSRLNDINKITYPLSPQKPESILTVPVEVLTTSNVQNPAINSYVVNADVSEKTMSVKSIFPNGGAFEHINFPSIICYNSIVNNSIFGFHESDFQNMLFFDDINHDICPQSKTSDCKDDKPSEIFDIPLNKDHLKSSENSPEKCKTDNYQEPLVNSGPSVLEDSYVNSLNQMCETLDAISKDLNKTDEKIMQYPVVLCEKLDVEHFMKNNNKKYEQHEKISQKTESVIKKKHRSTFRVANIKKRTKKDEAKISGKNKKSTGKLVSTHPNASGVRRKNYDPELVTTPFSMGWMREHVIRSVAQDKKMSDIYYFSPEGTKLRSMPDVLAYLLVHPETKLSAENFTFAKELIYSMPLETQRYAKQATIKKVNVTPKTPIKSCSPLVKSSSSVNKKVN